MPFGEGKFSAFHHVGAKQCLLNFAFHRPTCDAEIVDGECRCEQERQCEGDGNPVDASCLREEEHDADEVEPKVEGDEVEAMDGDAVVAEAADDADSHEQ